MLEFVAAVAVVRKLEKLTKFGRGLRFSVLAPAFDTVHAVGHLLTGWGDFEPFGHPIFNNNRLFVVAAQALR